MPQPLLRRRCCQQDLLWRWVRLRLCTSRVTQIHVPACDSGHQKCQIIRSSSFELATNKNSLHRCASGEVRVQQKRTEPIKMCSLTVETSGSTTRCGDTLVITATNVFHSDARRGCTTGDQQPDCEEGSRGGGILTRPRMKHVAEPGLAPMTEPRHVPRTSAADAHVLSR